MRFGPNAKTLMILRRVADADGNAVGDFAPAFDTWCAWSQNPGAMAAMNGQREDKIDVLVRVNDCPQNRTISNSDRVRLMGADYTVASVGLPERKSGSIGLTLAQATNG